jgi:phosphoribosyl-ATP pyrophosphohydrolase/phosphoribosyl-AMP cyclohydrolase/histidinol dehydrogenase
VKHYGALFVGESSAEVFGDYGAGPNHTLPTGGTARSFSGLSVHSFLKKQTFLQIHAQQPNVSGAEAMIADAIEMGLMEGFKEVFIV